MRRFLLAKGGKINSVRCRCNFARLLQQTMRRALEGGGGLGVVRMLVFVCRGKCFIQ